jgi:hypothetical protein
MMREKRSRMGTRADFYVGRGKDAEWVGSQGYDGCPDGIAASVLRATTEEEFTKELGRHFETVDHASKPSDGWPWPWEDSCTTDYAYAFDGGKVWAACFGHDWFDPLGIEPFEEGVKNCVFPDMTDKQNVAFGRRSGLMILSMPR